MSPRIDVERLSYDERRSLKQNVEARLVKKPDDPEAIRLLQEIETLEASGRIRVGSIDWEPYDKQRKQPMKGYAEGKVVAEIIAQNNARHVVVNNDVWGLYVLSQWIGEFRSIDEARRAADQRYRESR